jgi:CheY-like chemotaxis protein
VVDDEKEIRELKRKFLKSKGFTVHIAANGIEVIAVFKEHWQEISVVVTEIQLPKMDGLQMSDELLHLKAGDPGGSFGKRVSKWISLSKAKLLNKPCSLVCLAKNRK